MDCEWSEWKAGECSATCGTSTRVKTRTKLVNEENGVDCNGEAKKWEICQTKECPSEQHG